MMTSSFKYSSFTSLFLTLTVSNGLIPTAYAEESVAPDNDNASVTLETMTVSGESMSAPFQSQQLIKTDLGAANDGAELLKQTPGISLIRQGGTASDPLLRGLGGTRLNILIDDVPFAGACNHRMDPATTYVTPGSFDALSLLKGPQSVRNGNSIAGAVSFEREPLRFDEPGARAYGSYLYGSFNQQDISASGSAGFESGYLGYTGNRSRRGNYTDGDGNLVGQRINGELVGLTFYDTENDRLALGFTPDEDTLVELAALRSEGIMANATIHMDVTKLDRQNYALNVKRENINSWLSHLKFKYSYTKVDHLMDNFSLRPVHGDYIVMGQDWQQHFAKVELNMDITPTIQASSGIEYKHDHYDAVSNRGGNNDPEAFDPPDIADFPTDSILDFDHIAAYTEINYQSTPKLRWVAGLRVDTLGTDTGLMRAAGQTSELILSGSNQHRRQTLLAGFLRGEYNFDTLPVTASVGYGHAERAADYWEIFSMDAFALDAEENNEVDAMLRYRDERLDAELSGFYSHIDHFILVHRGDSARNIEAERMGGEFQASYKLTKHLTATSSLSYIYAKNLTQNVPLAQTPPLEGHINLKYERSNAFFSGDRFTTSLNTRLVAKQNRIHPQFGNVLALDSTPTAGFATLSLQMAYKPNPLVEFRFGIDNLLNKTYTEHLNRQGSGAGFTGPAIAKINEPGRAFWGRITINFDYPGIEND